MSKQVTTLRASIKTKEEELAELRTKLTTAEADLHKLQVEHDRVVIKAANPATAIQAAMPEVMAERLQTQTQDPAVQLV